MMIGEGVVVDWRGALSCFVILLRTGPRFNTTRWNVRFIRDPSHSYSPDSLTVHQSPFLRTASSQFSSNYTRFPRSSCKAPLVERLQHTSVRCSEIVTVSELRAIAVAEIFERPTVKFENLSWCYYTWSLYRYILLRSYNM